MFQHTIQDILALAEAPAGDAALLGTFRERLCAFEEFEAGEIVAARNGSLARFILAPGLDDAAAQWSKALGEEATLRFDTAADLAARGLQAPPNLNSFVILRLGGRESADAVLVLAHKRAWSFAAAPLSRVRALGNVALRMLLRKDAGRPSDEATAEVARLRAHVASLEREIASLRGERITPRSGTPR
jgi:hypothetical protein